MRRIGLAVVLVVSITLAPLAAQTQQAEKIYRVGFMFSTSPVSEMMGPDPPHPHARAFVHGLRDRGYVEGRNLIIERRTGEGKVERYREVVAELVQLHVDIIAVASTQVAIAAKQATSTIPIVCVCGNAVESGLVASLARPGANVTGVSNVPAATLAAKRLALFKEAIPRLSRVAVIYQPIIPDQRDQLNEFARAARTLNIALVSGKADRPDDFPSAYAAIARERVDGFMSADSAINYAQRVNWWTSPRKIGCLPFTPKENSLTSAASCRTGRTFPISTEPLRGTSTRSSRASDLRIFQSSRRRRLS